MAATMQNFGMSTETIEFSGSSEDDVAHAKSFWQSLELLPPMESRLVSSDIRQRLKRVPLGQQPVNYVYLPTKEDPKLSNFLLRAEYEQRLEQMKKVRELAVKKQETRAILSKHRVHRIQQELVSNHKGLKPPSPPPSGPRTVTPTDIIDPKDCLKQIDEFDEKLGLRDIETPDN